MMTETERQRESFFKRLLSNDPGDTPGKDNQCYHTDTKQRLQRMFQEPDVTKRQGVSVQTR